MQCPGLPPSSSSAPVLLTPSPGAPRLLSTSTSGLLQQGWSPLTCTSAPTPPPRLATSHPRFSRHDSPSQCLWWAPGQSAQSRPVAGHGEAAALPRGHGGTIWTCVEKGIGQSGRKNRARGFRGRGRTWGRLQEGQATVQGYPGSSGHSPRPCLREPGCKSVAQGSHSRHL